MTTIFRDSSVEYATGVIRLRPKVEAPAPSRPNLVEMVSVLASKHGFSDEQATELIALLMRVRDQKRSTGRPYILSSRDMLYAHAQLRLAIPRMSLSEPGSAHDILNRGLLEEGQKFQHGLTNDQCSVVVDCS